MLKLLVATVAFVLGPSVLAQDIDVGVVNHVVGRATYGDASREVVPFMKLREGDRITLAPGAQLRVAFFEGGRQESWVGPASFRAGKGGAEAISGKPAEVGALPVGVPQRIARVPDLVRYAKLGGIQVRGGITPTQQASLDQQAVVAQARATYEQLRKEAAPDDITPELYLYSVLHEYLLYDDMKAVAEEMLRRQPASEEAKALAEWLRTRQAR
jgi:hypothetical protein